MHYQLVFTNVSSATCTLLGFPGVSFLDSHDNQIGPSAQEGSATARQLVTLAPKAHGYAQLSVTDPGIPPCSGAGTVAHLRVYPPASTAAFYVSPPGSMQVCSSPNTANYIASTVGPVTATSGAG
jgi:hypothetical protein